MPFSGVCATINHEKLWSVMRLEDYRLKAFSITDIGQKRELNEDYVYMSETPVGNLPNLFIVADGMGGHNAGDYASKYTVETIIQSISENDEMDSQTLIEQAINEANTFIRNQALANDHMSGMGTTLVVATCTDEELLVANIGDSRLYVIRDDQMVQITVDHSLVEEMIHMGGIDRKSARNHPDKNIITRAVGVKDQVQADFFTVDIFQGDTILMCSDGLTNMLDDEEIKQIVQDSRDIVEEAGNLIQAANDHGGRDNIAVVLVKP